jgi:predicted Rossmann fold flavoprotein
MNGETGQGGPGGMGGAVASDTDILVVGAGAAGLFAATWASRTCPDLHVMAVDGAKTLGAKILVAGGGRCNVTHHAVDERDYRGAPPAAVRAVLRRFSVEDTIRFFAECGVELKREETGKLFPVTDKARTVLDALLGAASTAGVHVLHPCRVQSIRANGDTFGVSTERGVVRARCVILCTGGMSLPRSGSDGAGFAIARSLGHTTTRLIEPALVPLTLPAGHWLAQLSGVSLPASVSIVLASGARAPVHGKPLKPIEAAVLCTHFGLSGPAILDASRHWIHAHADDPSARLIIQWLPGLSAEALDQRLIEVKGRSVLAALHGLLPERFLRAACAEAHIDPAAGVQQVPRDRRQALTRLLCACEVMPSGTRGFTAAETTAGGIPLDEIDCATMMSRRTADMFVCGEVLDVDGRIGGFSFQWAWASGFIAGCAAADRACFLRARSTVSSHPANGESTRHSGRASE